MGQCKRTAYGWRDGIWRRETKTNCFIDRARSAQRYVYVRERPFGNIPLRGDRIAEAAICGKHRHKMTGLCADCIHAQKITSQRGSKFTFCLRSKTDPMFPKYPRLPSWRARGMNPLPMRGNQRSKIINYSAFDGTWDGTCFGFLRNMRPSFERHSENIS